MNIIFMGTPDFSVPTLETLINSKHDVKLVVTQPDRPKGRKNTPVFSPVKEVALRHKIDIYQPQKIKDENLDELRMYNPDVIVVVAFGQILSKEILELPKYGCINVHASLLPKYRGAAPIQWSILNGDKETGVTIMQMDEGLDTGDILGVKKINIDDNDTGESLFDKLSTLGGDTLLEVLDKAEKGELKPVKQDESKASYVKKLSKDMGKLDFNMDVHEIERKIRALYPWPGTFTKINGKTLKIMEATIIDEVLLFSVNVDMEELNRKVENEKQIAALFKGKENAKYLLADEDHTDLMDTDKKELKNGYVINSQYTFDIKVGNGILRLKTVQLEGKKRMDAEDFLRGYKIEPGTILGE